MSYFQLAARLIKEFEGCELTAYKCPAGIWTIGYGHTDGVYEGQQITQEDADALLMDDMMEADDCIGDWCDVSLDDTQRAALISFVFNLGCQAFRNSTLLKLLNAGDYEGAAKQFPRWNKANGAVLAGLTRRREAEKELFLT